MDQWPCLWVKHSITSYLVNEAGDHLESIGWKMYRKAPGSEGENRWCNGKHLQLWPWLLMKCHWLFLTDHHWSFLWDYTFHKWGHHLLLLVAASSQEEKDLAISIRLTRTGSLQGHHLETRWCQRDDLCRSSIWDNDDYIYIYIIWDEIKPR